MTKLKRINECTPNAMGESAPGESVVRNCKVLGLQSKNNRRYLPEAVAGAICLYEGVPVYFDHARESEANDGRSWLAKFGRLENCKLAEDGSVRADFRFNGKHIYAETFRGWLESDPKGIGFSHNATGRVREDEDGTLVIEEITAVESVDLVSRPATTEGLFESYTRVSEMDDLDLTGDSEAPVADDQAGDHEEHLANAVMAIFKDESMSLDEKKKKILALLKVIDDDETPAEEPAADEDYGDDEDDSMKEEIMIEGFKALSDKLEAKFDAKLAELTQAILTQAKVKNPVSAAPQKPGKGKDLTVEDFLAGL